MLIWLGQNKLQIAHRLPTFFRIKRFNISSHFGVSSHLVQIHYLLFPHSPKLCQLWWPLLVRLTLMLFDFRLFILVTILQKVFLERIDCCFGFKSFSYKYKPEGPGRNTSYNY